MMDAGQFNAAQLAARLGSAHIEAAPRTSASPGAIWVVIVVVVSCLAFWLIAVNVASRDIPARRRRQLALSQSASAGAFGGAASGRATAGAAEAGATRLAEAVPAAREPGATTREAGATTGEPEPATPPGGTRVPPSGAVRILGPDDADDTEADQHEPDPPHVMPAQRTTDTDEPLHRSARDDDRD
jgi:hypothetical protein